MRASTILGAFVAGILTAAAQPFCQNMGISLATSRTRATAKALNTIVAKRTKRIKAVVTVINANTTHDIESIDFTLGMPDGVVYLQTPKNGGGGHVNSTLLPAPTSVGVIWRGVGPIPAQGSDAHAKAGTPSAWTQALELWTQPCVRADVSLNLFGIVTLSGGGGTCEVNAVIPLQVEGKLPKKSACSATLTPDMSGMKCTQTAQCTSGGAEDAVVSGGADATCINDACVPPLGSVGDSCTLDTTCGPGNNCINGRCQYCARIGQGCGPPDACPGETEWCQATYPDTLVASCKLGWGRLHMSCCGITHCK